MRCPKCLEQGEKHIVYPGARTTTLLSMSDHVFWDENNWAHDHNSNTLTDSYHCSRGHYWAVKRKNKCPVKQCDWNKSAGESEITFFQPGNQGPA